MVIRQWEQLLGLKMPLKTQMRVPVEEGNSRGYDYKSYAVLSVYDHLGRPRWRVGQMLAVQPAANKKAVGRTPPIKAIRRERLGDISKEDVFAEGLGIYNPFGDEWYPVTCLDVAREMYANLWNSIHGPGAWGRMEDNDVWVLEFENIKGG